MDKLVGRILDNKYRLDAELGAGGMGSVYRATRLLIGDAVAVKILHPELVKDTQAAERFRREAQAAARLKHPNVVTVHDFGITDDGLVYLVMELVEGESLRHIIKRSGALPLATAAEITRQVCAALDEAHESNIVHRDVKPDNIIVRDTQRGLRVKVLDFGIARLRDISPAANNLTQTGTVMGTPHYMSPEQCLGEEADHRADIYSVGVILYEMLTGTVPFNSPTPTAIAVQHATQQPSPLRAINMSIPPEVETVVLHALAKRREERPQTAGALAQELTDAINEVTAVRNPLPGAQPSNVSHSPSTLSRATSGAMPTMVMPSPATQSGSISQIGFTNSQATHMPPAKSSRTLLLLCGGIVLGLIIAGGAAVALWSSARDGNKQSRNNNEKTARNGDGRPSANANENQAGALDAATQAEQKVVSGIALSESDIAPLSIGELRRLRNAVFARHGRVFDSPELQQYFISRPWYTSNSNYTDEVLTSTDRTNVAFLKAAEDNLTNASRMPQGITVTTSSSRSPYRENTYVPSNTLDGRMDTAWIEGAQGAGIGEWIRFDFGREVNLKSISFAPGYFKDQQIWAKNNRLSAVTLFFSDGSTSKMVFADAMRTQDLVFDPAQKIRWVQLRIDEVYYGSDPDTAISEVQFEFK